MSLAPIALFAFNRPKHLEATMSALAANRLASDSDVVVFCDGPRSTADEPAVAATRQVARAATGFRSVEVVERLSNLGLASSITAGVNKLCTERGSIIVVEDDLETAPEFLHFMNAALDKYADHHSVMQVSGYRYPVRPAVPPRPVFLPVTSCWGWGTWQRAWECYDPAVNGLEALIADRSRVRAFNLDGNYDYLRMLKMHRLGQISSWGVVWHFCTFMRDGLTLYPPESLVSNRGTDGSGTHGETGALGGEALGRLIEPIFWPDAVKVDEAAYSSVKRLVRESKKGMRHWLRNLLLV
jgi:hypothetical protein